MNEFIIKDFGQIITAEMTLGDLTVIIGPQASGKSISLQLFKLLKDYAEIGRVLKKHGFDWHRDSHAFLQLYFGENLQSLWRNSSIVNLENKLFRVEDLLKKSKKKTQEKVFYIPAQRVITLENGWPKPFTAYRAGDPYIVKNFSEKLRLLMESGLGTGDKIFPQDRRLKKSLREYLDNSIFHGAEVKLDTQLQRRIVLDVGEATLPYMTWSAGQREFMPLLLGLYWLMPSGAVSKKTDIDWVIIEEPEMGLHPRAILALILIFMDLIDRGYKLIISTHSTIIPQTLWALQTIKKIGGSSEKLFELFGIEKNQAMSKVFQGVFQKSYYTYYYSFAPLERGVLCRDISSLDPSDEDLCVADWGGLTEFISNSSEVVSKVVREMD